MFGQSLLYRHSTGNSPVGSLFPSQSTSNKLNNMPTPPTQLNEEEQNVDLGEESDDYDEEFVSFKFVPSSSWIHDRHFDMHPG